MHFTAWLTTDTTCLDQPNADVVVLRDQHSGDPDDKTPWTSTGEAPVFHGVTRVDAKDGDFDAAIREAEALLHEAGWRTRGGWETVPTGSIVTVERA